MWTVYAFHHENRGSDQSISDPTTVVADGEEGSRAEDQPIFQLINADNVSRLKQLSVIELTSPPQSLTQDPSGRWIVIGTQGGVSVYDVQTGELVKNLEAGSEAISVVSFSSDGSYLAAGCDDGFARIWETTNFKLDRQIPLGEGYSSDYWIRNIQFHSKQNVLFAGVGSSVQAFQAPSWIKTNIFSVDPDETNNKITEMALSGAGHLAIGLLSGEVYIVDALSGKVIDIWRPDPENHSRITALSYDFDGYTLIAGTGNLQNAPAGIYGYRYNSGIKWKIPHRGWVSDVQFVLPGVWVHAAESQSSDTGHDISVLREAASGQALDIFEHPDLHIRNYSLNLSKTKLALSGAEDLVSNVPRGAGWVSRDQRYVVRVYGLPVKSESLQ